MANGLVLYIPAPQAPNPKPCLSWLLSSAPWSDSWSHCADEQKSGSRRRVLALAAITVGPPNALTKVTKPLELLATCTCWPRGLDRCNHNVATEDLQVHQKVHELIEGQYHQLHFNGSGFESALSKPKFLDPLPLHAVVLVMVRHHDLSRCNARMLCALRSLGRERQRKRNCSGGGASKGGIVIK